MIHRRCDQIISQLREELHEERERVSKLQEALVDALQDRPAYVHNPTPGGASIHYMDDEAMVEAELHAKT